MLQASRRRALGLALLTVFALASSTSGLGAPPGGGGGGKGGGPKKGTIVGEVVGPSGPIAGATVLLFDELSIDQIAETVTDPAGNFQFRRLAAGSYSLTAVSWNPPCSGSTSINLVPGQKIAVLIACQ